jgi:hypothetical protein
LKDGDVFIGTPIYILKSFSKENSRSLPGNDIGEHEADLLVCRHPVAMAFTPIKAQIDLKKGYNLVRFHLPEVDEPHCSIPKMKTDEGRCLNVQVEEITVQCERPEPSMDLGDNWHWMKDHNGSHILCITNDATMLIWVENDCRAKLGLQAMSFNQSRYLEIYTKAVENKPSAKKYGNRRYILMKETAPRPIADMDIIKSKIDEIMERSQSEI